MLYLLYHSYTRNTSLILNVLTLTKQPLHYFIDISLYIFLLYSLKYQIKILYNLKSIKLRYETLKNRFHTFTMTYSHYRLVITKKSKPTISTNLIQIFYILFNRRYKLFSIFILRNGIFSLLFGSMHIPLIVYMFIFFFLLLFLGILQEKLLLIFS